jgi:flagellar motor switch/type III secretory pathway protein FliN
VTPARIGPFPWRSLAPITRAEAGALRDVHRWAAGHVRVDVVGAALCALLGAKVEVLVAGARPLTALPGLDDGVGVVLARADSADVGQAVLIEAEGALASNVVARVLKRPASFLARPGARPSPSIAGALAALLLATARRAHAGVAMRVLGVGPAPALEADFLAREPELVAVLLNVLVSDDAFAARVVVSPRGVFSATPPPWDRRALAALGPTPLALPIVACVACATAAEVGSLRPGDAVTVPSWPLARGGPAGRAQAGPVLLAPPSFDLGLRAQLGEDGRLVLGAGLEPLLAMEAPMDSEDNDAVATALGEVPLVLRVEIGEAVMTAREWASLGRGDVVALGRRAGEPVVLRVGGVPLARGELVELDGEVAVRIVERWTNERT